jgi:hypothetical protein
MTQAIPSVPTSAGNGVALDSSKSRATRRIRPIVPSVFKPAN